MRLSERSREGVRKKRSNEIPVDKYLETLQDTDRQRISNLISAFQTRIEEFQGETVGIIAFGSSVRPPKTRYHPIRDIDLRILSSAPGALIDKTVEVTRDFAEQEGYEYKFNPRFTESLRVVEVTSWDRYTGEAKKEVGPFFLDYNNHDPSFIIQGSEGSLPLHISISSHMEDTVEAHLQEEKRQNQYFSVLAIIPPGN